MAKRFKSIKRKWRKFKNKFRPRIELKGKNYEVASAMLLDVARICEANDIDYAIDSGTLLGLVRDGDLIPWDFDIDLTLPSTEVEKFQRIIPEIRDCGWRVSGEYLMSKDDAAWRQGDIRSIKMRNHRFPSLRIGRGRVALDIFITYEHNGYRWWAFKGLVCRVSAHHFKSRETMIYKGQALKLPTDYEAMLEALYGSDWRIPDPSFKASVKDESIVGKMGESSNL